MIYVFFADGFEEVEGLAPVDILRRAGKDVKMVGVGGKTITGAHGIAVVCDCEIDDVQPDASLEAVILPGGADGTAALEKSGRVHEFIDFANENGRLVCAICAAPSILGNKGLLRGKKATAFPSFQKYLDGAELSEDYVVRDGNIITARGAGVSLDFGLKIAEEFIGTEKANSLKESLQCKMF